ncbi:putative R3h domain containing protein [Quillaja saponaria]|uniref:R3h domain containing protein n=1 Tax=Quillaja saponaria TaxID=32244 RepID=A0AAD7PZJ7_QUISA|nr:putative R3h domain containing protein [Quillaja saponaria]
MESPVASNDSFSGLNDKEPLVDPFLVEALQNPRHRLTILRMELDIQRFLQNPGQQHFEFQHFTSSYLRLAAHRVAQHYGLQTMVLDNGLDGQGNKIVVRKLAESKYPVVRLSEIPAKQLETDKAEHVKIVIRPRPNKTSLNEANDAGIRRNPMRSVEERKEDYDRARARIFSSPSSSDTDDTLSQVSVEGRNTSVGRDDNEGSRNIIIDSEKTVSVRDPGNSSRVAIFRDREKDRGDPDYDRSYGRYVRTVPTNQSFNLVPFNTLKVQAPFAHYGSGFSQLGQMPQAQASLNYGPTPAAVMSPFCAMGINHTSTEAACVQWPSAAMMYAHSYDQFRHDVFQAPFGQQPLSFDYSQNY